MLLDVKWDTLLKLDVSAVYFFFFSHNIIVCELYTYIIIIIISNIKVLSNTYVEISLLAPLTRSSVWAIIIIIIDYICVNM